MSHLLSGKIILLFLVLGFTLLNLGCQKEQVFEENRLFRPALKNPISVRENVITLDMAKLKEAIGYQVEVSRDTFKTVDYTVKTDTNYVVLNDKFLGESLLYNTLYQIRVTALAASSEFNSRPGDLGAIRTERFPSIIIVPRSYDVTDTKAKVRWSPSGALVSSIKIFASSDLRLTKPLNEYEVSSSDAAVGERVIDKLLPSSKYQIAIFSGSNLRGWVDYQTFEAGVDKTASNVVDLSESEDPKAVVNAFPSAPDGAILLLKKGFDYDMPIAGISKSITIKGDYGFTDKKAGLVVGNGGSNWAFANGVKALKVVFDDLEIRGLSFDAHYVFNPANTTLTDVEELRFENCIITNFRGVIRTREMVFIRNFIISNSIVSRIRDYGIFTTDTDGDNRSSIDNIVFKNSTFSKVRAFSTTRQNIQSWLIENCTFNEFTSNGQQTFRFRGVAGKQNVIKGITIKNSIWGTGWDETNTGNTAIVQFNREGMKETAVTVINSWATSDFSVSAGHEVAGFPSLMYSNTSTRLWADPKSGNFNIRDLSFGGRTDSGDPRWRIKL